MNMDFDFDFDEERFRITDSIDQTYNYKKIGDFQTEVLISRNSPIRLQKNIIAAIKAYSLGYKSIDYVYKKYSDYWFTDSDSLEETNIKNYMDVLDYVKNYVNTFLDLLENLDCNEKLGLIVSRAALYRLQSTFKSILLLMSRNQYLESMNLCRVILEQCSWAFCVYTKEHEEDIFSINPLNCLKDFKTFYTPAGSLNGFLSNRVHISPEVTPEYLQIINNKIIVTFNPISYRYDCYYSILSVTDMYCSTIEYIFRDFINKFYFVYKYEKEFVLFKEREFVTQTNIFLDNIRNSINNEIHR